MAKVSKKKTAKKSVKKRSEVVEEKPEVAYDEENEEEIHDEDITSEDEQEEHDGDERRRQKLLEAIGALGGRKRRTHVGERSEAAVNMSEFSVTADGEGDRVQLSELIGTMEKTPAVPNRSTKQLKVLQRSNKTVESPLSRQESDRIQRDVAFQKAAAEVTRWSGVIKQNQRAEQLVFPLHQEPAGPRPVERLACGWKARTPLEEEIFSLLTANKQPINDPILTPAEEASVRAMSLEEAKIRRAELQKARALQSYYESRARRERRIKSKKYHKVHNKAKRKELLKQFEEMAMTDPAAALEELRKMDVARMQERMTLKHQNSGKWAKSKAIMAKYDQGARKAMQEQLEVNKELTMKVASQLDNNDDDDEEEEVQMEEEVLPDFVNDAERGVDPSNPWMRGKLSEDATEQERSDAVDLTAEKEVANTAEKEEEEEREVDETEEEVLLREFENRRKLRQAQDEAAVITVEDGEEEEEKEEPDKEEEELSEFTNLFREIAEGGREAELATNAPALLEEGLRRVRTLDEVELLSQEGSTPQEATPQPPAAATPAEPKSSRKTKRKRDIELKEVLTKGTKDLHVPLEPTMEDGEDAEEQPDQRRIIREAFAGDDVVSDFLKDKKTQEDATKPKVVDLTLPGWGEWGGKGLKPSRAKRRRFRTKAAAPPPPRRDLNLTGIIISEKRNAAVGLHQVNSLPFPFENHTQFESTIRTPLGRTWNTERTVKKITKPRVVTRLGAIIPPIAREELLKDRQQAGAADIKKRKH